jgi:hypothetical protein
MKDDEKGHTNMVRIPNERLGLTGMDSLRGKIPLSDGRFIFPEEATGADLKDRARMIHGDPANHSRKLMALLEAGAVPRSGKFPALMDELVALWKKKP